MRLKKTLNFGIGYTSYLGCGPYGWFKRNSILLPFFRISWSGISSDIVDLKNNNGFVFYIGFGKIKHSWITSNGEESLVEKLFPFYRKVHHYNFTYHKFGKKYNKI